ncbi:hypothetical protein PUNSTDRAFT_121511 [Punctularia strigosozonata HHB-11173 SS5]|uniref:uncharacterized protein n=1 Tax=Punctularia strigosozonata (strain HHB-11173) TaxID=741275 RepID=UPI0004417594|nr:uncharacterized protein PUNSTDRAFT_121511 [Punctularia strigosozonata HHB-11173 SS5]EIN07385.1 hypothetical protein PUNSTDRAFT_121511 [Punctularia strigosozonata HHB-11173 SS5]
MSRFMPPRASSPARPGILNHADVSLSSTHSVPDLLGLTDDEIAFLDRVVERAGPSATTFLAVFKAYNDVLHERGLDPQNEVVYYGKLLKLGTLKGQNWAEKWKTVKAQNMANGGRAYAPAQHQPNQAATSSRTRAPVASSSSVPGPRPIATRLTSGMPQRHTQDSDTFTLHSHDDGTENGDDTITPIPRQHYRASTASGLTSTSIISPTNDNSLGLHTGLPSSYNIPRPYSIPGFIARRLAHYDSEGTEAAGSSSTTPPSYGAATRSPHTHIFSATPVIDVKGKTPITKLHQRAVALENAQTGIIAPTPARLAVERARERKGSVLNEDDAWKKIREAQDEEDAVRWYNERLQERCWNIWRQGYEWIITTHEQVAQARENLNLRLALHRWRAKTAARLDLYERVTQLANRRLLRLAMRVWADKLHARQQAAWRHEMRAKMKRVKERREAQAVRDAWARWRQAYHARLGEARYRERLLARAMGKWRKRLAELDELDVKADQFMTDRAARRRERLWERWRDMVDLRAREKHVESIADRRVLRDALQKWKERSCEVQRADDFYDVVCLRAAMSRWKAACARIQAQERKADKHMARQDDVLVRAVMRVWKAHERGRLLERVRAVRLLKHVWAVWNKKMNVIRDNEDIAAAYALRGDSSLAVSSLRKWRQAFATHQNAQAFAVQYHDAQLRFKYLLEWRVALRQKLKMMKQARKAEKIIILRRAMERWKEASENRRREAKLTQLQAKKAKRIFGVWRERTRRQIHLRLAEQVVQQQVALRIVRDALKRWLDRTVEIKSREIDVVVRRERLIVGNAFMKWKAVCLRHVEELSLLESYQDVKREEMIRRMFHRWLQSARAARHRRITLQRKEEELRCAIITMAWEQWRGRFKTMRLRPLEREFALQTQKHVLYRAFGIWHSKTTSLPAVRFHASHVKAKAWKKWRDAMPGVLQAKAARDMHKQTVLKKSFNKWLEVYRTKVALKAVARARFLRLPTAAPRVTPRAAATRSPPQDARPAPRRRSFRTPTPEPDPAPETTESESEPVAAKTPPIPRPSYLSRSRRRAGTSASASSLARPASPGAHSSISAAIARNPSPTRFDRPPSSSGTGEGRSKLLIELKELQRRSRTPTTVGRLSPFSPRQDPL